MALNYNPEATKNDGNCAFTQFQLNQLTKQQEILGCMDSDAINFNSKATKDNGSCEYEKEDIKEEILGCMNTMALNFNKDATKSDGSCVFTEVELKKKDEKEIDILGCTNLNAINFNPEATKDDGSCLYTKQQVEEIEEKNDILGCTNESAINFNPEATKDDGTCAFTQLQLKDKKEVEEILGCKDPVAINYNSNATKNDDSCIYKNEVVIYGCTDDSAINFNQEATDDDGSCEYPPPQDIFGCMDKKACNYNKNANISDDSCQYLDLCGVCGGSGYFDECDICDDNPDNDCTQDCMGEWGGTSIYDNCGICAGDNSTCTGCIDPEACNTAVGSTIPCDDCCLYMDCTLECDGNSTLDNCGMCDDDITNDCIQDCEGNWGGQSKKDECGICNPDLENIACTGCMDPKSINFNDDCYYYDLNDNIIYECLFNDTSCLYNKDRCCNDVDAINYNDSCDSPDNDVCIYGFDFSDEFDLSNFKIFENQLFKFDNINFINLFYFPNKSSNVTWNYIKENNRDRLVGNNVYLFKDNVFLNPLDLIQNKPISRDMKIGYKKKNIFAIDKYNFNLDLINDVNISLPVAMSFNDYFQLMLHKKRLFSFREIIIDKFTYIEKFNSGGGAIVLYSNDFFSIELKGSITIAGSLNYVKQDQITTGQDQNDINLSINQTQQFTLAAYIGNKLKITANQNSQSDFDWENTLKISYTGYQNEIVKQLDIGNINLSLGHGTLASVSMGSSGLFGAKLVTQFGPLEISSILGREKAIKNSSTYTGGQASEGFTISDYNFIRDKYFFIDAIFKSQFYPFSENNTAIPIYNSNYVIKDFILFKKKTDNTTTSGYQPGAAYFNLDLDASALNETENRRHEQWYQLVENVDYILNKELGYIRLLTPTTSDMIAVHYTVGNVNEAEQYYTGTHVEFDICIDNDGNVISDDNCHLGNSDFIESNYIPGFQSPDICNIDICVSDDPNLIEGQDYFEYNNIIGYQGSDMRLKLIKDNIQTTSNSHAWDLMWKNVYTMGSSNIDLSTLNVEIIYSAGQTGTETVSLEGNSFLNIFGLDQRNESGQLVDGGDGKIDLNGWFVNAEFGEIMLPYHMPFSFDPQSYELQGDTTQRHWGNPHPDLEGIFEKELSDLQEDESPYYDNYTSGPSMYYESENDNNLNTEHKFNIKIEHSSSSSTISLGFMVIENSERVLLNGSTVLVKGTDYTIDYWSGNLNLISERATDPTAEITVTYDQNELISFDQKIIAGSYMVYQLNDFTDIYGGLYYYAQTLAEEKVDVGYEPMQNVLWHIGADYDKDFKDFKCHINENTFLDFSKSINFNFGIEYAQVFPNPNPLGKAYIDDFESSKELSYIPVNYSEWKISTKPIESYININNEEVYHTVHNRIDMYYYNPYNEVNTVDIWEDIEVTTTADNQKTRTLWLELDTEHLYLDENIDQEYWAGINYQLMDDDKDQSQNKYLDIWMNTTVSEDLVFHIDLGVISEDINDSGQPLSTEDNGNDGIPETNDYGEQNNLLDENEDIGFDGCIDEYEDGWGGCLCWGECINGGTSYCEALENNQFDLINPWLEISDCSSSDFDPNRDNFSYTSKSDDYSRINGTEGNRTINRLPDSEDTNSDDNLSTTNKYFSVSFNPTDEISSFYDNNDATTSYIVSENGIDDNNDGQQDWKLYRIPLSHFEEEKVGDPQFTNIETIRVWISTKNISEINLIKIAKMELVGNKWKQVGLVDSDKVGSMRYDGTFLNEAGEVDKTEDIVIEVVNNEENPLYEPPEGVSGEYDEYEGRFLKEQALSINFSPVPGGGGIGFNESYFISKATGYGSMDTQKRNSFFAYKNLEMFVNGIPEGGSNWTNSDNVEYSIRLGRPDNYYEIRLPFLYDSQTKWDSVNIDLEVLSRYKYDNILDGIDENEDFLDTGIDGCYDEYETGQSDFLCIPDELNITTEEICENNITCYSVYGVENECDSDALCYWDSDINECSNIEFNNLFSGLCDQINDQIDDGILTSDECNGGCYYTDECIPLIDPAEACEDLSVISDPNDDNNDTEGDFDWTSGEPILNDNNYGELSEIDCNNILGQWYGNPQTDLIAECGNGIFDDIADGEYDYINELWYWEDGVGDVCKNCTEIRVKGEPSISRVEYIMFGIVNNSSETIWGKVYLNEIRLTGVKKESGSAYKINADFQFGDLFSIGGSYTETDADFRQLETRIPITSDHSRNYKFNFSIHTNEFFRKYFYDNPISLTYNRTISAPKFKSGTDIYFGSIENTPDELITHNDNASFSTSFQSRFANLHDNFFFADILDKSKITYTLNWYTKNNPTQGYEEQTSHKHTWIFSYIKSFSDSKLYFFKKIFEKERWKDNDRSLIKNMKEFNISLVPSKINYTSTLKRTNGINIKSLSYGGTVTYDTTLTLDRVFSLSDYELFNDLTIDYGRTISSNMSDLFYDNSAELKAKSLLDISSVPGLTNKVYETFTFMYIPEYLGIDSWLSPKFIYTPKYTWNRSVLTQGESTSASIVSDITFTTTFNLSISKFLERFYTASSSSSSRSGRYSSRTTNTSSASKPFEAKNIYMKSLLKFLHQMSQKLSGFNITIKKDILNEYSNINTEFEPNYKFKLGLIESPVPIDKLNTIQANSSQAFIYTNEFDDEFKISTTLQISPKISITSIEYRKNRSRNYPSNSDSIETRLESFYPQGKDGKSGLPLFNWSLNVSSLQSFWILEDWFKNIMITHQFNGTKEETFKNSELQTLKYTKNFNPYVGFTFKFRKPNDLSISIYNNSSLTINNQKLTTNEFQIDRIISDQISFSLDWTKRRTRDLKLFKQNFNIENEISFSLDITLDDSYTEVSTVDPNIFNKTTFTKSLLIKPGITYGFSEWIDGTFYLSHLIKETHTVPKKSDTSIGFDIRIYFESRSSN